jgi:hypothetical protein
MSRRPVRARLWANASGRVGLTRPDAISRASRADITG